MRLYCVNSQVESSSGDAYGLVKFSEKAARHAPATGCQPARARALLRRVRDRIDREYAQPLDVDALARGREDAGRAPQPSVPAPLLRSPRSRTSASPSAARPCARSAPASPSSSTCRRARTSARPRTRPRARAGAGSTTSRTEPASSWVSTSGTNTAPRSANTRGSLGAGTVQCAGDVEGHGGSGPRANAKGAWSPWRSVPAGRRGHFLVSRRAPSIPVSRRRPLLELSATRVLRQERSARRAGGLKLGLGMDILMPAIFCIR